MARPRQFEDHRWLGDKRNQVVHDLDAEAPSSCRDLIDEMVKLNMATCFGPDLLAEARNRGYRRCPLC